MIQVSKLNIKLKWRYSQGAICGRCPSLNTLDSNTPTPSNTPSNIPQAIADPSADLGPPIQVH